MAEALTFRPGSPGDPGGPTGPGRPVDVKDRDICQLLRHINIAMYHLQAVWFCLVQVGLFISFMDHVQNTLFTWKQMLCTRFSNQLIPICSQTLRKMFNVQSREWLQRSYYTLLVLIFTVMDSLHFKIKSNMQAVSQIEQDLGNSK